MIIFLIVADPRPTPRSGHRGWAIARRTFSIALAAAFLTLLFVLWPEEMRRANGEWGWPVWRSLPGAILGSAAILAGGAVALWCGVVLVRQGRGGTPVPSDPPRDLVVTGPYRVSRNPMYLAYVLVVLGEALLSGEAALFLYVGYVALGTYLWVVLVEERGLRRRFGEGFAAYAHRVPRWIGRPRRAG